MNDKPEGPKVVDLKQPDKLQASLEEIKRALPIQLEYFKYLAVAKRAYYLEMVKIGFTPEQALELTKTMS